MKALFKSHFPFVETPEEELDSSQKLIKTYYENTYPDNPISDPVIDQKEIGQNTETKAKGNKLRKVHVDELGAG
jgi:hypothetical protein